MSINPIKLLIFQIPNTGHEIESQQMTERKDNLGVAMSIGRMLTNFENRIVVEQPVKDIQGFTGATGNYLSAEDRILIGDMGVDANSLLVVAIVAGVIGCQQTAGANAKTLCV